MKRSHRLQRVVDFTAEQESEAAKILGEAARQIDQALSQIESMRQFRSEYSARLGHQEAAMTAMQLHEYRAFLTNLGRAIEEQEAVLAKMRQQHAALQLSWKQAHCRNKGVSKVQQKLVQQEREMMERRIQSELDDRAAARRRKKKVK